MSFFVHKMRSRVGIRGGRHWYVSPTGNNSNSGRAFDDAYLTVAKVISKARERDNIHFERGGRWYEKFIPAFSGLVIDAYGDPGDDPPIFDGSTDILGVVGDWTNIGSNRWTRSFNPADDDDIAQASINGAAYVRKVAGQSAVVALGDYYYVDSTHTFTVYSVGNPASTLTSIRVPNYDCIKVSAPGVSLTDLTAEGGCHGIVWSEAPNCIATRVTAQYNSRDGMEAWRGSHHGTLIDCVSSYNGLGPTQGCHGLHISFAFDVYGWEAYGCDFNHNGEDGVQVQSISAQRGLLLDNCNMLDNFENSIDVKQGFVEVVNNSEMDQSGNGIATMEPIVIHGYVEHLQLTIRHSHIKSNDSIGSGTGISVEQGTLILDQCWVEAQQGYGVSLRTTSSNNHVFTANLFTKSDDGQVRQALDVQAVHVTSRGNTYLATNTAGLINPVRIRGGATFDSANDIFYAPSSDASTYCLQIDSTSNFVNGANNLYFKGEASQWVSDHGVARTEANIDAGVFGPGSVGGVKTARPQFVDYNSGDYRLSTISPALAAGLSGTGVTTGRDGAPYGVPPNIGCMAAPGVPQVLDEGGGIPPPPPPPTGDSFYLDFTGGDDGNDGLTPAAAWKTLANINAWGGSTGKTFLFKRGESWPLTQLVMPTNNITFDAYGSGVRPRLDFMVDGFLVLNTGWTEVNTAGVATAGTNLWRRTYANNSFIAPGNNSDNLFIDSVVSDGRDAEFDYHGYKCSTIAAVLTAQDPYAKPSAPLMGNWTVSGGYIYVYSVGAPGSGTAGSVAMIKTQTSDYAVNVNGKTGIIWRNIDIWGGMGGFINTSNGKSITIENTMVSQTAAHSIIGGGDTYTTTLNNFIATEIGSQGGNGHHGIYPTSGTWIIDGAVMDRCGEDCLQVSSTAVGSDVRVTNSRFSRGTENQFDVKTGAILLQHNWFHGGRAAARADSQNANVTTQGFVTNVELYDNCLSMARISSGKPAVQVQEERAVVTSHNNFYYSHSNYPMLLTTHGGKDTFEFDVFAAPVDHAIHNISAEVDLVHCSLLTLVANNNPAVYLSSGSIGAIAAVEREGTTGYILMNNTAGGAIGLNARIDISGLTGGDAAWNDSYIITDSNNPDSTTFPTRYIFSILGTTGDWTDLGSNRWSRTYTYPKLAAKRATATYRLYIDSSFGTGTAAQASAVAVDGTQTVSGIVVPEWYYDTGTEVLTIYATANPATAYATGLHFGLPRVTSTFTVPASLSQYPDQTNMVVTIVPRLGRLDNCLAAASSDVVFVNSGALDDRTQTAGSFVVDQSGTSNRHVYVGGTRYTYAQMISDVAAAGNLSNDTGGKLGGSLYRGEGAPASGFHNVTFRQFPIVSLVSNGSLTASHFIKISCTAASDGTLHSAQAGEKILIHGATNFYDANGSWFVDHVDVSGNIFVKAPRRMPDWVFTGAAMVMTQCEVLPTSLAYGTAPAISFSATQDAIGQSIPVSGRNYGAVMPKPTSASYQTYTYNLVTDFGAISGNAAASAAAFNAFSVEAQKRTRPAEGLYAGYPGAYADANRENRIVLNIPAGNFDYTNNKWGSNLRYLEVIGAGNTVTHLRNVASSSNWHVMLAYELDKDYYGDPTYDHYGYLIDSIAVGATTCTLKTPTANKMNQFRVGRWIYMMSYDQQGYGYSPNMRYFDWAQVTAVDTEAGTVTWDTPTIYAHRDDRPYYGPTLVEQGPETGNDGAGQVGPARIVAIDTPDKPVGVYHAYRNFHQLGNPNWNEGAIGSSQFTADVFAFTGFIDGIAENLIFQYAVQHSMLRNWTMKNCSWGFDESDKNVGHLIYDGCTVVETSNHSGQQWWEVIGGTIGKASLAGKKATFTNCTLNGTSASGYTWGFNLDRTGWTDRVEMTGVTFLGGASNPEAHSIIEPDPDPYTITVGSGGVALVSTSRIRITKTLAIYDDPWIMVQNFWADGDEVFRGGSRVAGARVSLITGDATYLYVDFTGITIANGNVLVAQRVGSMSVVNCVGSNTGDTWTSAPSGLAAITNLTWTGNSGN